MKAHIWKCYKEANVWPTVHSILSVLILHPDGLNKLCKHWFHIHVGSGRDWGNILPCNLTQTGKQCLHLNLILWGKFPKSLEAPNHHFLEKLVFWSEVAVDWILHLKKYCKKLVHHLCFNKVTWIWGVKAFNVSPVQSAGCQVGQL